MAIAAFLVAMVGPIMARVLASLGLSLITITGLVATIATLKNMVVTNVSSLPAAALGLGGLFGCWEALGIVFGSVAFVIAWRSTKGFIGLARS